VTQTYDTGVCIYFYFAYCYKGVPDPTHVYHEIEAAAREEVLRAGGSLSHHHGVGQLRSPFLKEVLSETASKWRKQLKAAIDPDNLFGVANQDFSHPVRP
jgi:alkyldihydroxyacetonephosphate synthase